jgi:hypothetical protein
MEHHEVTAVAERTAKQVDLALRGIRQLRAFGLVGPLDSGYWVDEKSLAQLSESLRRIRQLVERGIPVLKEEAA